jgi:hypothetical protein
MDEGTQMLCDALKENEASVGSLVLWAGGTYPCTGGPEFDNKKFGIAGYMPMADVTLVVRLAALPAGVSLPAENQQIAYKSVPEADAVPLKLSSATLFRKAILLIQCDAVGRGQQ